MNVFDLFAKISIDTSEYESGLEGASEKTSGFGSKLKSGLASAAKVGAAAIGAATAAVTAFATASVNTGMTFDSSMSQVAATMGTTVDQIQDLRDFAMEMGAKTAFSASEAADALNYMALAGYDATTSMEMLPTVLDLAAAGGIDLASASDMVTDAQSALGLSIKETTEMVDKMAMASSKSNTSVAQLGEAILTIGGTAQNLAGGTTELSTALGILADNGIKGAEGGTHLRNVILSLSSPTDTAAKALSGLGVEVFDASGNMRPLNDTLGDLNEAMSSMTQAERTDLISTIFNKTDIAAVNALLANSGERWNELTGYIDNASGAAAQMAETQLDNLAGDITKFQSALEGAQIVLSDQLTPDLREFVQFGTDAISTLSEAFQEGGLSGAMDALGTILSDGLNMIIEQLPKMVDAGMQLLGALGQGIIDNLPTITDSAIEIVVMLADGIMDAIPNIVQAGVDIIKNLADGLAKALPELVPTAIDAILELVDTLTDPETLSTLIDAALEIILALADGLIEALPNLIEKIPEIIINIVESIIANLPKILEAGLKIILKLAEGLIKAVPELIAAIPEIIAAIVEGFVNQQIEFYNLAGEFISWILDGLSDVWDSIVEIGSNIVNGIKEGISNAWKAFTDWIGGLFNGIVGGIKDLLGIHSPSKVFAGIGENMALGLGEGWDDEFSRIKGQIEGGMNFGTATMDFASSGLGQSSQSVANGVMSAVASNESRDITINLTAMMDGNVLARTMYRYNKQQDSLHGSSLVGG